MILGIHMTLLIGPTFAVPAPIPITEAIASVEVTQNETGRSGFQLTFQVGRSGPFDVADYQLLLNPLLRPFNRVVVMVHLNLLPTVLIDGFITQLQLTPSDEPGRSTLVVTGEDVSIMMGLEHRALQYPMPELAQIPLILATYPLLGFTGAVIVPPLVPDLFVPTREIPTKNGTDYDYLQDLAARHGHVFYIRPGLAPNTNIPYWGPPVPPDALATSDLNPALSVNMGPHTNAHSLKFAYDALAPAMVLGEAVEPLSNRPVPVVMPPIGTGLPLALIPAAANQLLKTRVSRPGPAPGRDKRTRLDEAREEARIARGLSVAQAFERARASVSDSAQTAVTATGELDALEYGSVLQARTVVGLRGAGYTNDGKYFVNSVTHSITKGEYKQRFTLRREGIGPIVPLVRP